MQTTSNLSGQELPQQGLGSEKIIRRKFPKTLGSKKRQSKKKFLGLLEKNGNWDWYNQPSEIGSNWKQVYPILNMARKYNYVNTAKGQGGKFPGFFHYMNSKKKKKK